MTADQIAAALRAVSPAYAPTPTLDLPSLAAHLGVAQVLVKDESRRYLGSFKSLGGTFAGLRALSRAAGMELATLLVKRPPGLPALLCASDGNHGLAVAAAARHAGAAARVFLPVGVPPNRAARIAAEGAAVIVVTGTYDDAVDAAAAAARAGDGILIADTTDDPDDPVVADVMAGYGVIAAELHRQIPEAAYRTPTHAVVQAGVGGLAAAIAAGVGGWLDPPGEIVVVEPQSCAAVAAAVAAGRPMRLPGELLTEAGMLSCGEASAPALKILRQHRIRCVTVSEAQLIAAPALLRRHGGPASTPSGAASLAGALAMPRHPDSRILLLATEGEAPST